MEEQVSVKKPIQRELILRIIRLADSVHDQTANELCGDDSSYDYNQGVTAATEAMKARLRDLHQSLEPQCSACSKDAAAWQTRFKVLDNNAVQCLNCKKIFQALGTAELFKYGKDY